MTSSAIAVSGLRKAYGDKVVLDGIDLDVRAGTVFSLLGPNGAGKTTTVNVLTTLMKADGGTVRVAGHDVATEAKAVRAAIGVTGQFAAVDELLTGQENLQLMVDLNRVPAGDGKRVVAELLERFDLVESAQQAGVDLLRRYAPQARPGDDAGRQPADHLPGRADDGPGPAQPPHDVVDHPRAGGRRRDHLPHHPVPRGSRPARRPDRGARPGPPGRPGHARRAQAPDPRHPRPAPVHHRRRARRGRAGPDRLHPGRRGTDPAGAQRRRHEVAAGPAGPARRVLARAPRSSPCTPPTSTTFSSP